ncbi:hypothetical protein BLOT_012761 [Blomia tropicalis]|nr:hypothetical protein BLOT_012761 [Blomia tropicalis]
MLTLGVQHGENGDPFYDHNHSIHLISYPLDLMVAMVSEQNGRCAIGAGTSVVHFGWIFDSQFLDNDDQTDRHLLTIENQNRINARAISNSHIVAINKHVQTQSDKGKGRDALEYDLDSKDSELDDPDSEDSELDELESEDSELDELESEDLELDDLEPELS